MKKNRTELMYFRAFICIVVVITHILTHFTTNQQLTAHNNQFLYYIRNIFIFGTPSFIILSQVLTTLNYKTLRNNYLTSRFKFIFIPYVTVGLFYAFSEACNYDKPLWGQIMNAIILGKWYGYFIFIIMQFFVLNFILYKLFSYKIFNSKILLVLSFIFQEVFLHLYNLNPGFAKGFDAIYPISSPTFLGGWIFYYFLGGYIGLNYDKIVEFLKKYVSIVLVITAIVYFVTIVIMGHNYMNVSSFREQLTLMNSLMFLSLLGLTTYLSTFMFNTFKLINGFSFFIYLMHPVIIGSIYKYTERFNDQTIVFFAISLLFILGICIGVGILLREIPIFKYVIGKQPYKLKL
ncbi:polysaccharide intercellular adhesin biosynthesis/export protein IcaC [Staphylococcus massiliensis]|uniref:polysaccharide intercellular adhesin biosynthesis/export protein IcaC n=1 Tax=Staphylococcus massiliensis TaxID=555791 RepID=UPI001EE10D5E|nr:polysaccharide intercellular adhesin biosynthesis/export protein IcaC [Staphylococcus massiliensis]MCG3400407.1 polysaccharide intercellular adhesin biosynthesis/export protein IcaC [Staphylococcus massiliensis]